MTFWHLLSETSNNAHQSSYSGTQNETRKGQWPCTMHIMVDTVLEITIWHFQVWASLTKSRHCKYLMDGCTLRIRGMCARSDGPWKTERPVAQTLLVRLLHTSYMCQFPLPCIILLFFLYRFFLGTSPTYIYVPISPALYYSLVLYRFFLGTSPSHKHVPIFPALYYSLVLCRFFLWTSPTYNTNMCQFSPPCSWLTSGLFCCFLQILLRTYMCQILRLLFYNLAASGGKQVFEILLHYSDSSCCQPPSCMCQLLIVLSYTKVPTTLVFFWNILTLKTLFFRPVVLSALSMRY